MVSESRLHPPSDCAPGMVFKVATEEWEFEQIHRLNYRTFVEEIPQHAVNSDRRLVDRFHAENTYFIALRGQELVGMIALREKRPFSLDAKVANLDRYLPSGCKACEVRLLAAKQCSRNGTVFRGLLNALLAVAIQGGYDLAVASGTTRQAALYEHLGFTPFASLVGTPDALYQPMFITLESIRRHNGVFSALVPSRSYPLLFLPGPVELHPSVTAALAEPPTSHRSCEFTALLDRVRCRLRKLTGSPNVQILAGTGTLANDMIAAQLSLRRGHGVIVSNGEFGERLFDHATRFNLDFREVRYEWGTRIEHRELANAICASGANWVWAVHGETSTGVLNDLQQLKAAARESGADLYVDAVSSIGNVPVDLAGVKLASGVSGKGLGSCAGLSLVFHADPVSACDLIPRYLDLGYYAEQGGVPFTLPSSSIQALNAALEVLESRDHFARLRRLHSKLAGGLASRGLFVFDAGFPGVATVRPSGESSSQTIAEYLKSIGILVNSESDYLQERNWFQISLMGHMHSDSTVRTLLEAFSGLPRSGVCRTE